LHHGAGGRTPASPEEISGQVSEHVGLGHRPSTLQTSRPWDAQAAAGELAKERGPENLSIRPADVPAEHLAPAIAATATMRPLLLTLTFDPE
jgi:hypothetical protein